MRIHTKHVVRSGHIWMSIRKWEKFIRRRVIYVLGLNGEEVLHKNIRTDLEAVWDTYQAEVLPDCKRYIEEKNGGIITPEQQPFFQELLLDVTGQRTDSGGLRED